MKDVKDYLHLYIGCDCAYGKSHWAKKEWHFVKITGKIIDEQEHFIVHPILRPLSDMTPDELREWLNQPNFTDQYCQDKMPYIANSIFNFHNAIACYGSVDSIPWLLRKGFDLFNLIPEGLAIDATKT